MAGNIKGINIEIGGNTIGLEKALSGVNKKSRDLQSELRQVEKLLKLDPKNTELLAQKQKLLSESVENTKNKLDNLKEAEKQVQKQFEKGDISEAQYRALQREIVKTEDNLKGLEKQAEQVSSKLNKISIVSGKVGDELQNTGEKLVGVTTAVTGLGVASITMAQKFDESFAKVKTIADSSQISFEDLKKQIIELSNQTGISANLVAEDVYNAISAGIDTASSVDFISLSTKLAKGGFAESSQALDILTTILNAYGLEVEDTAKVSDMLIQTQNKGKVTVGELAASMGKVIPTAKSQNVALEQVTTSYAVLTSKGIKSAEATTYLNSMINELGKSGTKSSDVLKNKTGKTFSELMNDGNSLADVLKIIDDDAKASRKSMGDMFGSAEASKSALTLLSDGVEGFNDGVAQMLDSTGATEKAFETMQTPAENLRISLNKIKNASIKLGDVLSPVFEKISEIIENVANKLTSLDEDTLSMIATIAGIVAVIAPVLIIAGKIASIISAVSGAMVMLKTATLGQTIAQYGLNAALLANPITWVITGIVALIAIIVTLWNKNEAFRDFIIGCFDKIKEAFTAVINWFIDSFTNKIPMLLTNFTQWIGNVFTTDWTSKFGAIGNVLNAFLYNVSSIFNRVKTIFSNIIDFIKNVFTGNWTGAWEAVKNIFANIFGLLFDIAKVPINNVIGLLNMAIDGINVLIKGLNSIRFEMPDWEWLPDNVQGKSFGIDIPEVPKIPMMAKGGVLTNGEAIVAEAGPELIQMINGRAVVTPLTKSATNTEVNTAKGHGKGGGDITVNVYSPKALTAPETARQFKRVQRQLALGV